MPVKETTVEIKLDNLKNNLDYLKSKITRQTKFMAVVKAFSYGSDSITVSKELERLGVDYLAVAYTQEGVDLRKFGIKIPILVLHPQENDFNDCVILNNSKTISESLKGNIFMVMNDKVLTPPLKDGSNNNVIRTKIIELINNDIQGFDVIEQSLSVFDIQKSNELFISNINFGIQPVYKFRKKVFTDEITSLIM
mgnify:CR=1 FL=1